MNRHKLGSVCLLLAVVCLFLWGVAQLFVMRFQASGVYPAYSSYRAGPRGVMAFYESLGLLPGVTSLRSTEPLDRQSEIGDAALFLIGLKKGAFRAMDGQSVEAVEKAAREGGRIVVTFDPEQGESSSGTPLPSDDVKGKKDGKQADKGEQKANGAGKESGGSRKQVDLRDRWHLDIQVLAEQHGSALLNAAGEELPPSLDWHSAMVFEPKDSDWRTIYARNGKPTVMERKMGKGEVLLSSDSFFSDQRGHERPPPFESARLVVRQP